MTDNEQVNNSCVYIAFHKDCELPTIDGYIPLLLGASEKQIHCIKHYCEDNIGVNISNKNNAYCELTGLYWIWKNTEHSYVGLVHYRRFFARIYGIRYNTRNFVFKFLNEGYHIYTTSELSYMLEKYDIIVKKSELYKQGNKTIFENHEHVGKENWRRLKNLIRDDYPEYYKTFCYQENEHYLYNCNMFFSEKKLIDEYCKFLFSILDKMDRLQIIINGQSYNNREEGYFSEFLFGVWLQKNNLKVKVLAAVNTSKNIDIEDCVYSIKYLPVYCAKKLIPTKMKQLIKNVYKG